MKKNLLLLFSLFLADKLFSQELSVQTFNQQRQTINKRGLFVISSWAAGNIMYGSIAASKQTGSTKYFHQMNAIWNGVTLGLASFGLFANKKNADLTLRETIKTQATIEKVFIVNTALDGAYVIGGLYLKERSKRALPNSEKLRGYGEAIMLQGSVLLVFDGLMYMLHNKHGKQLYKLLDKVALGTTENGIGMSVKL
jgi:hypothetical protein